MRPAKYPIASMSVGDEIEIAFPLEVDPETHHVSFSPRAAQRIENAICQHQRLHGKRFNYKVGRTSITVKRVL